MTTPNNQIQTNTTSTDPISIKIDTVNVPSEPIVPNPWPAHAKIKNSKWLLKKIEQYAVEQKHNQKPLTRSGFLNYLGVHKATWDRTAKHPELMDACALCMQVIEQGYEEGLTLLRNPTGAVFALKNFGWQDRQELDVVIVTASLERMATVALSYIPEDKREQAAQAMRDAIRG